MEFWDSFKGVIHSNQQLSDGDKFEYLRDSLEGKAKTSIASVRLMEASYKVALQMLVRAVRLKKYEDCAHWDKSVRLGTETHYRLYVKNFKGDTHRKSCDC